VSALTWWVLHRNDPLTAANWVAEAYRCVAETPGIPADRVVVVQETSFPSGAVPPEAAPGAAPENEKRFYEAVLATNVPFVWSFAVDSPMHRKVSPPGGFGALRDENWQPSPSSTSSPRRYRQFLETTLPVLLNRLERCRRRARLPRGPAVRVPVVHDAPARLD
jgi:hypothetical protein